MLDTLDPQPVARLRIFGAVSLVDGQARPVAVAGRRPRALLGYLAMQADLRATRSRLAGMFWADRGEAQARASLRQCLTDLRGAIGDDAIEATRDWVALRPGRFATEIAELDAAIFAKDASAVLDLAAALGARHLLDEPALSDVHQDWLDQTREGWERRFSKQLHGLLAEAGDGDPRTARRIAEALILRQPLDEVATAAAIRADAALGAGAQAVQRYNALKLALSRELGVEPAEIVQQALKAVMTSRAAPPPGVTEPPAAGGSPPLLIVCAFQADEDQGLAESLREEVIDGLSRFRDLALAPDNRPERVIREEAWSRREDAYLVVGAYRRRGLTVQVLRLADQKLIWSGRAALDPGDSDACIDEVITQVVSAIYPSIQDDLEPRLAASGGGTFARYLRARGLACGAKTYPEARAAADVLEALIAEEPGLSFAHLQLARLYNTDFGYTRAGASDRGLRDRAFELAKTAMALDRGHVHAYTVVGWCHLWRRNWDAAQWHFDKALELNPFHAERLLEVGFGYCFLGELKRARELLERRLMLTPAPHDGFFVDLGFLELLEGRPDLAVAHFDRVAAPTMFDEAYAGIAAVTAGVRCGRPAIACTQIKAVWPKGEPMDEDAVAAWFADQHPIRSEALAGKLNDGFRQMLAAAWS